VAAVGLFAAALGVESLIVPTRAGELTVEQAQKLIDESLAALPKGTAMVSKALLDNTTLTVQSLEYGELRNIKVTCAYKTLDLGSVIKDSVDDFLNIDVNDPKTGKPKNATKVMLEVYAKAMDYLKLAELSEGTVEIGLYETETGKYKVWLSDSTVNTVLGGIIDAQRAVNDTKIITVDGVKIDITNRNSLRRGCVQCFELINYDKAEPDTGGPVHKFWNDFKDDFYDNFIYESRWMYLVTGLGNTLAITALALILGVVIGFIVAAIRCTNAKTGKLKIANAVCKLYLAVMRGTPVMVQLLIIFFVILLPLGVPKFLAAVLCFGVNSGAYVSEIVRGGIMSIDEGQTEAGRSLGLGYVATMWYIVIPQAFKAILPSLANEFITLLKETSVAFYIGVADLTQGGLKIRSLTFSDFMPLLAVAAIYLILVLGLSYLVSLLERRLRKSER
jgi:His/Glu/Gln/Arg/opine family amino acid ABC transporter permease subunit